MFQVEDWLGKKYILDWEQILIHNCKMIYNERYGKHTRQLTLETIPNSDCELTSEHPFEYRSYLGDGRERT